MICNDKIGKVILDDSTQLWVHFAFFKEKIMSTQLFDSLSKNLMNIYIYFITCLHKISVYFY